MSALAWGGAALGRGQRWVSDRTAGVRARAEDAVRAVAAHPARLVWTLVVTLAYVAAARPMWGFGHALWVHFQSWGFLLNQQNDYGEGPLFNQEVLLYHGRDIYTLLNTPPFALGNYPPVFPLVASLVMRIHSIGMTFMAGRLTSSVAVMASAVVAGLIVMEATGQVWAAFIGGGMLLTFPAIYQWGPFNRVDSLAMFFSLCTVWMAVRYAGTRKAWWVLPFAVLTIYTRQSDADGILASFVYLFVRDWRRCLTIGVASIAAVLAVFVGLQIWSHGAFYLNTVLYNENAWNWGGAVSTWHSWMTRDGGLFVFRLAVAGAAAGLVGRGNVLWPVWLAGSVAVFATIGKTGAAINYFFPVDAAAAVCLGVFIGRFRTWFRRAPFPMWPVELVLPAMLFFYIHGALPGWAARVPLMARAEAAVGSWTLQRAQVAGDYRHLAPQWARDRQLRAEGRPVPGPKLHTPSGITQAARFYASIHGPVLALDFPRAEPVQGGHEMQWQPFELGVAYNDGHWNPAPFLGAIRDHYYAAIVFESFGRFQGYDGGFGSSVVRVVQQNYHQAGSISGLQVWEPDGPPLAPTPPVGQVDVPHPLSDLWHGILGLPQHLHLNLRGNQPATLGGGLRTFGAYREVDVSRAYSLAAVANEGSPPGLGFDGMGAAFPAAAFPSAGTLMVHAAGASVPFYIPPSGSGRLSAVYLGMGATVTLPPQRDGALWLLEAGVNGAQTVPVQLQYTTGGAGRLTVRFSDWCRPGPPPEYPAFTAPYRIDFSGARDARACGLYALRIPTDPGRTLQRVVFGDNPNARLVAVTVQKG